MAIIRFLLLLAITTGSQIVAGESEATEQQIIPLSDFDAIQVGDLSFNIGFVVSMANEKRLDLATCISFISPKNFEMASETRREEERGFDKCVFIVPNSIAVRIEACFLDGFNLSHGVNAGNEAHVWYTENGIEFKVKIRPSLKNKRQTSLNYHCLLKEPWTPLNE